MCKNIGYSLKCPVKEEIDCEHAKSKLRNVWIQIPTCIMGFVVLNPKLEHSARGNIRFTYEFQSHLQGGLID